jgi:N-acetylglucosamine-6-sulfatase
MRRPQDKPGLVESIDGSQATSDATILARMRMMKAVDESMGAILDALARKGVLDDTLVVLTSDHGYFYGEHCLGPERRLAYEEAIRIPLLARYPRRFAAGSRPEQFVLSTDVAATALTLAGVRPPRPLHGRPLWEKNDRDAVLIEYFSDHVFPQVRKLGYDAVRTRRWKYIRYRDREGADELYDLRSDPFELRNVVRDPKAPLRELQARLDRLRKESSG